MVWRQLREKYSHSGVVWPALHHIPSEYWDLLCESKCGKKFAPEKRSEHGHFPHSSSSNSRSFVSLIPEKIGIEVGEVLWFMSDMTYLVKC